MEERQRARSVVVAFRAGRVRRENIVSFLFSI